ncbi:MAG: AraC family transcriptional regulator [Bacteroidota bacterium]
MIQNYQKIELLHKTVFERVSFVPPLKATELMENEACLIYALNGSSQMYGAASTETLSSHDSVLMKCGNFINHWQIQEENSSYEAIAIHFYPDVLDLIFEHKLPDYLTKPINHSGKVFHKIEKSEILKSYINSLMVYFENPSLFSNDVIQLKLKELISLLYNMNINGIRELLSDMFNPSQIEFKKVISEHIFHGLSLEEYATLLNMSLSTFKRKFKELYHSSPGQYMLTKRLEKAAQLLVSSSLRISDICFECGFNDLSNFTKAFSKKYSLPPSEYKGEGLN